MPDSPGNRRPNGSDGARDGEPRAAREPERTGTGAPPRLVRAYLAGEAPPQSPDAVRQLEDAFGPARHARRGEDVEADYDDVVQQSFPASDPPPPRG